MVAEEQRGPIAFPVPTSVVEALRENAHQKAYLPMEGLPELWQEVARSHRRKDRARTMVDWLRTMGEVRKSRLAVENSRVR